MIMIVLVIAHAFYPSAKARISALGMKSGVPCARHLIVAMSHF